MIGELVNNYRVVRSLGKRALGESYLGEASGRSAAILVLAAPLLRAPAVIETGFNSAQKAGAIQNAGLARFLDCGWLPDGRGYFASELLEGETLCECLLRTGTLVADLAAFRAIATQAVSALEAVHKAGLFHLDLRPENFFLATSAGSQAIQLKLLGLGLSAIADYARASANAGAKGRGLELTPNDAAYLSPEQCGGSEQVDGRADVYALGCVFFEMLTGRPPFVRPSLAEVMSAHTTEPAPSVCELAPAAYPGLDALVARMLEKKPADRPQSMAAVLEGLEAALAGPGSATVFLAGGPAIAAVPQPTVMFEGPVVPRPVPSPNLSPAPAGPPYSPPVAYVPAERSAPVAYVPAERSAPVAYSGPAYAPPVASPPLAPAAPAPATAPAQVYADRAVPSTPPGPTPAFSATPKPAEQGVPEVGVFQDYAAPATTGARLETRSSNSAPESPRPAAASSSLPPPAEPSAYSPASASDSIPSVAKSPPFGVRVPPSNRSPRESERYRVTTQRRKSGFPFWLVAGGIGILALGGVIAFKLLVKDPAAGRAASEVSTAASPTRGPDPLPAGPRVGAAAKTPSNAEPVVVKVSISVDSTPQDATVTDGGGNVLGSTPVRFEVARDKKPLVLRIEKKGYAPVEREVDRSADAQLSIRLRKAGAAARKHRAVDENDILEPSF